MYAITIEWYGSVERWGTSHLTGLWDECGDLLVTIIFFLITSTNTTRHNHIMYWGNMTKEYITIAPFDGVMWYGRKVGEYHIIWCDECGNSFSFLFFFLYLDIYTIWYIIVLYLLKKYKKYEKVRGGVSMC